MVSTPSAWASKPFWEEKKNLFLCTECSFLALSSAGTDPGRCRDRMAARLHFRFFSTAGSRRDSASCKISHLGTKTIDIIYQSFLSAPVALGAAELATLQGLVLAAMPWLTSGLKLPLKHMQPRGSFGQLVRDTWPGRARSGCSASEYLEARTPPFDISQHSLATCPSRAGQSFLLVGF